MELKQWGSTEQAPPHEKNSDIDEYKLRQATTNHTIVININIQTPLAQLASPQTHDGASDNPEPKKPTPASDLFHAR